MNLLNNKYTIISIVYLSLIFIQSSIPSERIPHMTILTFDKLIHAIIYFIAAILIYLAIREHRPFDTGKIALLTFTITVFYGLSDEIHQYFVPGRHASFRDFLADTAGVTAGLLIVHVIRKRYFNSDSDHLKNMNHSQEL